MKLVKSYVERDGKRYTDLNLVWTYNGKEYAVRVRPCFKQDFTLLLSNSETLPDNR